MAYGYSPATHTPWGSVRQDRTFGKKRAAKVDQAAADVHRLWSILHGYTPATHDQKRAAFEQLKAMGVEV